MDWRHEAACRDKDPDIFFPLGSGAGASLDMAMARAVCSHCPVVQTCLDWAIDTDQLEGVWGGMSLRERNRYARRRPQYLEWESA